MMMMMGFRIQGQLLLLGRVSEKRHHWALKSGMSGLKKTKRNEF
jgi:hypothetical protein